MFILVHACRASGFARDLLSKILKTFHMPCVYINFRILVALVYHQISTLKKKKANFTCSQSLSTNRVP